MKVARADFYQWLHKPISDRAVEDQRLVGVIRNSYAASGGVYGTRRVLLSQVAGLGRIAASAIRTLMGPYTPVTTVLCTDAEVPYRKFAKEAGIEHHELNAKAGLRV